MKTFVEYLEARGKFHESLKSVGGVGLTPSWRWLDVSEDEATGRKDIDTNISYFSSAAKNIVVPKLYDVLERGSTDIHIYFGRNTYNTNMGKWKLSKEEIISHYEEYFFRKLKIPKTDIVYVKEQGGGDVWKPWIVLHGLSHAILDNPKTFSVKYDSIKFRDLFNDFYLNFGNDILNKVLYINSLDIKDIPKAIEARKFLLSKIFKFSSARTYDNVGRHSFSAGKFVPVGSFTELVHEIFTWFLYNGEKLPLPSENEIKEIHEYLASDGIVIEMGEIKNLILELFENLILMFKENLKDCRGHVVVD